MPMCRVAPMLVLAVVAGCRASSLPAPAVPRTSAYVVQLGRDTIAVDQYTRVGDRVEGTLVVRAPRTVVTSYVVTLNGDGTVALAEASSRLPDGTVVPNGARSASVVYSRDSAVTHIQRDSAIVIRSAARGAFPYINYAALFYQLPIDVVRAGRRDSLPAFILPIGGRTLTPLTIRTAGAHQYVADLFGFRYHVRTDEGGVIQAVDGTGTTQQFLITRRNGLDVSAISTAWAERERQTQAMGALSPRDTVRGVIGHDTIFVDYGRPAVRGRQVFAANGVLNDTLWRTGANAATQLWTSRPLRIGGQELPAGKYSLWTLAIPGRYQLIVNRQTGQWGTVYDPKQDLLRVPLTAAVLPAHFERFTMLLDPSGDRAGTLRMRWATTELSVPVTIP